MLLKKSSDSWDIIYDRLEEVAMSIFGTLGAMATDMGKHPGTFSSYKSQKKPVGKKILFELRKLYGINPEYILYGTRPVFLKDTVNSSDSSAVFRKDIIKYKEYDVLDTDEETWEELLSICNFSGATQKVFKVHVGDSIQYFNDKQFDQIFKKL
jgi:hypothetical protein